MQLTNAYMRVGSADGLPMLDDEPPREAELRFEPVYGRWYETARIHTRGACFEALTDPVTPACAYV